MIGSHEYDYHLDIQGVGLPHKKKGNVVDVNENNVFGSHEYDFLLDTQRAGLLDKMEVSVCDVIENNMYKHEKQEMKGMFDTVI